MHGPAEQAAPDERSAARQRVQRQLSSLVQAAGWLLGVLERHAEPMAVPSASVAERLRHAVRELHWTSGEHERLEAFADALGELEAEAERAMAHETVGAEALAALAVRIERGASEGLSLYVALQAEAAAEAARMSAALPDEADEEGRRHALAQFGAAVRTRLDADPGAEKLRAIEFELYRVRGFVDSETCAALIAEIERDLVPSAVLGTHPDPEFRTSRSCNLPVSDPLVDRLDRRIAALLGIDPRFSETVQGQRYEVGQQFKPHHDYFHAEQSYYADVSRQGGQRTWTAMLFLNEPERGGATNFPNACVKVHPEAGTLLVWNNMRPDGTPNPFSLHQGSPVEAGRKYVITKWFRERPWGR